jgi:predicted transposase/invertase (TIGR01784 family)
MEKESFIEDNLKASISDVLFLCDIKADDDSADKAATPSTKTYVYLLLEHQSKPDRFMAFRILRYMMNIIARHMEQNPRDKTLPLVYPVVFYNGTQKYNAPLNIWELFKDSKLAKDIWTNDYKLINVQEIPDEEFKTRIWSGILEFFLKNIHHRNLLQKIDEIADIFPKITKMTFGIDYLELMLTYSLTAIDENDTMKLKEVLTNHLNNESGEKLMTSIAERFAQEGRVEGRVEGVTETAINMLAANLDIDLISQCTKLPVQKIEELKNSKYST